MPMATEEDRQSRPGVFTREPVGPKNGGSKNSVGDVALKDAICIVLAAWAIVFFLAFSLRSHNV